MKIRLTGSLEEIERTIEKLKMIFSVVSISAPYKNRNSEEFRVYMEIKDLIG